MKISGIILALFASIASMGQIEVIPNRFLGIIEART
jgi:hypothetical protein